MCSNFRDMELNRFQKTIKVFFRDAVKNQETFSWNYIPLFIKTHRKDMFCLKKLVLLQKFFLEILQKFDCNNPVALVAITDLVTVLRSTYEDFVEYHHCFKEDHILYIVRRMMLKRKFSFYPEVDAIQVMSALRSADSEFMKLLAKYGFNGCLSNTSTFHRRIAENFILNFL